MSFRSIDGHEIEKHEGYCNYKYHSGYLSQDQKYKHQCLNKICVFYFKDKPTKNDIEERKNKILFDFHEMVKTRYLRHSLTKEKYEELMAKNEYIYAHNFTFYYKNNLDISSIDEVAREMLLNAGEIDPDEFDNIIMPLDKCGTRDTSNVAKAYKSVYGDYRVFVPIGYCKKYKCYISDITIKEKKCLMCESYRKNGNIHHSKSEIKEYKLRISDYKKIIQKIYNANKITSTEYCKLINMKDDEYIKKFMKSYKEGIVLRDYYKKFEKKTEIKEPEYVDIKIENEKPLTWWQKVIKWFFKKF